MIQNELKMLDNNPKIEKIAKKDIKQQYKTKAENALDNVVRLMNNSKMNGYSDFMVGEEFKAPIIRYYRNYWIKDMVLILSILSFLILISSFYLFGESQFIFIIAFVVMWGFSETNFMKFYLKNFNITKIEEKIIINKIFPKRDGLIYYSILMLFALLFSLLAGLFSDVFFLNIPKNILNYLSISGIEFKIQNTIFSFVNFFLMLLITTTKVIKLYRR